MLDCLNKLNLCCQRWVRHRQEFVQVLVSISPADRSVAVATRPAGSAAAKYVALPDRHANLCWGFISCTSNCSRKSRCPTDADADEIGPPGCKKRLRARGDRDLLTLVGQRSCTLCMPTASVRRDDTAAGPPCAVAWTGGRHACLGKLIHGTLCKMLNKPHKVRYYMERRAGDC
jgi:hypothetical protein